MKIVKVNTDNLPIYLNLAQGYEAEFSGIINKKPGPDGRFALDTHLDTRIKGNTLGYLLYLDNLPAGLAAVHQASEDEFEVCEFYVLPVFRGKQRGLDFAQAIFARHGGNWQIKQVAGAHHATAFWRKVVSQYTKGQYCESTYQDDYWGAVIRQSFSHQAVT